MIMTRTFFSKKRAEEFANSMRNQGFESVQIWTGRDGFGQTQYIVKWF